MKKVSINTIAAKAGVSKTTVSFVLNGRGNENSISKDTQKKILAIAADLNYRPNQVAKSLISGRSSTIGLLVPDISNPFFARIGLYVEQFAYERGYSVMLASSMEDPQKEIRNLNVFMSRQIDGVIIAPTMKNPDLSNLLDSNKCPVVFFDRVPSDTKHPYVNIDNEKATFKLTGSLIEKGHRHIGLLSLTSYLPNIASRIKGYQNALRQHGLEVDEQYIFDIDYNDKNLGVKKAMQHLLNGPEPVTAIIFLNNLLAAEGIWCINKFHKKYADKLALACFDNLEYFDYAKPTISSIIQPRKEIAGHCVNMLIDIIENDTVQEGILLDTKIIER